MAFVQKYTKENVQDLSKYWDEKRKNIRIWILIRNDLI